jgi:hypothetical protein
MTKQAHDELFMAPKPMEVGFVAELGRNISRMAKTAFPSKQSICETAQLTEYQGSP